MPIQVVTDLRGLFGPVRDQGTRPTCMAFAGSDAHAGARPGWEELCAEWAYFYGLAREGGAYGDGISLAAMLSVLELDGQPLEPVWPYSLTPTTAIASWNPPPGAPQTYHRCSSACTPDPQTVIDKLAQGQPVLLAMKLSDAFYFGYDAEAVVSSAEPPDPKRRHAVIAVAHGQRAGAELVLIRNSWGADWGDQGHAWLDVDYLTPRLYGAAVLTQEP